MALYVKGTDSKELLNKIIEKIQSGDIRTWTMDRGGNGRLFFTHISEQWKNKAWFHPYVDDGSILKFGIVGRKGISLEVIVYAEYHGKLASTLLSHFDRDFSEIVLSSQKIQGLDISD